jgi:spermidine/putrescine transport system ATP-binding protein
MLELKNITKNFSSHSKPVLNKFSLDIPQGEFISLLGPSGCGKTTLLRILSGLEQDHEGELILDGKSIKSLPPQKRPFNMVFQKHALFPHLNVFENIAYGLKMKKVPLAEIKSRVANILKLVDMESFNYRLPETLSGGQSQRIALARALVNEPKILLLDESLSALDQKLRAQMQRELKGLQRKLGITFIFVTHDQEESFVLSDRVVLMNNGKIEQEGSPNKLYDNPETLVAARFVGGCTEFPVSRIEILNNYAKFKYGDSEIKGILKTSAASENVALIRPERINLVTDNTNNENLNNMNGKIISKIFRGDQTEIEIRNQLNQSIRAYLSSAEISFENIRIDQNIKLSFSPDHTFIFQKVSD